MKIEIIDDNLDYIFIDGVKYKKENNSLVNKIRQEFEEYLDSLPPELYNRSLENYGNTFDLKYFSDLYTIDELNDKGLQHLQQHITFFKKAVAEECLKMINELVDIWKKC